MKLSLVILAVVALVGYSTAAYHTVIPTPTLDDGSEDSSRHSELVDSPVGDEPLVRQKRFTCDLLSFSADGVSGFNHAACAAKCLTKRHFGGHCDGPECKCVSKKW